jgi:DNA-directed RNA polymerase subunit H (RpoH/RPB5)
MAWFKQPKHSLLSVAQAKRQLKALKIDVDRLPLISIGDAAIRQLVDEGVTIIPGDIILIERQSVAAGEGFRYYRKVVV